jgi:hypothetical protein
MFFQCLRCAIPVVPLCANAGWLPPPFVAKVAVGMPVARHPPPSSRRAALPHRAPASGRRAGTRRCLPYAAERLGQATPARGPAPGFLRHVPLGPLPSRHLLRRSRGATCVRRLPRDSAAVRLPAPGPHGRAPWVPRADLASARPARGRASRVPHTVLRRLPEVSAPAGSVAAWPERRRPCGLPHVRSASAPETSAACGAPYSACVCPCHRFADTVTDACA